MIVFKQKFISCDGVPDFFQVWRAYSELSLNSASRANLCASTVELIPLEGALAVLQKSSREKVRADM